MEYSNKAIDWSFKVIRDGEWSKCPKCPDGVMLLDTCDEPGCGMERLRCCVLGSGTDESCGQTMGQLCKHK